MFNQQQPTSLIVTQVLSKDMAWQLPAEVGVLEDVGDIDDVEHAHIHHPQAPQVPKCLHPAPVGSLPRLAKFHHLDHSENPLGVSADLVHDHSYTVSPKWCQASAFPPSAPTSRET